MRSYDSLQDALRAAEQQECDLQFLVDAINGLPIPAVPSVPMTVRHRPPWSLDPMGRKDDLAHAHGSDAERRY
jgi:hypothetical protein